MLILICLIKGHIYMNLCLGSYRLLVSNEYDTEDLSLLYVLSGECVRLWKWRL